MPPDTTVGDYRRSLVRTLYTTMLDDHLHELTQQADAPFLGAFSGIGSSAPGYESFSTTIVIGLQWLKKPGAKYPFELVIIENSADRKVPVAAKMIPYS